MMSKHGYEPLSKERALGERVFHEDHSDTGRIFRWRRSGQTKTWKTRPYEYRVPVKFGLFKNDALTTTDDAYFHAARDCRVDPH